MSISNALTSGVAPDKQRLVNGLDMILYQHDLHTQDMIPARVVSYDRAANAAVVQPLIMFVMMDDSSKSRQELANVPVLSLGGGGFHINFPLAAGSLGWIKASDRDLTLFKKTLTESIPTTGRTHRFDDSLFIPDTFYQYTVAAEDSGAMVIQSVDGLTKISIRPDNIKIAAPTKVLLQVPLVEISQNLLVDGNLEVKGNATVDTTLIVAGIDVNTHGHISSAPGNRTAGSMIE